MNSPWTHPICDACFEAQQPGREPFRMRQPDPEVCCWCGEPTASGVYVRADPKEVHPDGASLHDGA